MPSFFRSIARAIQGKPLFDDQQTTPLGPQSPTIPPQQPWAPDPNKIDGVPSPMNRPQGVPPAQPANQGPSINRADSSSFPVVRVKHTTVKAMNGHMEVWARIVNDSPFHIELHRIEILGKAAEVRYPLNPGQERDLLLYNGPCMRNNAYHDMDIQYKVETGAYFKAIHDIRYMMNADRSLSVDELNLRLPIRHIAG